MDTKRNLSRAKADMCFRDLLSESGGSAHQEAGGEASVSNALAVEKNKLRKMRRMLPHTYYTPYKQLLCRP